MLWLSDSSVFSHRSAQQNDNRTKQSTDVVLISNIMLQCLNQALHLSHQAIQMTNSKPYVVDILINSYD